MLGSVTAFADGELSAPETTEPTEIASRETEGSWSGNTYTDNQGIVYELNGDGTITLTDGRSATGEITIPEAIEKGGTSYPVTRVEGNAFENCWQLVSVTFSGNIDSIGDFAFKNCGALESVTFSGDVGSIGYGAFRNCGALEKVTFSGKVGSIGDTVFGFCDALENVTFSGKVGSIGGSAFYNCDALKTVTFSGKVGNIGTDAFGQCSTLDTVTFSGDVGNIWDYAFFGCDALKTLTFSGDVDSIGDFAFGDCTALTTIYVPASTTKEKIEMIQAALDRSGLPDVKIERSAPEQPSDPATDPSTPSVPSTGTTGSASNAVQQLEAAERPDPMDVEATERYNFWMDVKSDLRAAGDGRTVRVYVPADYTNMPASVMETIRTLGKEITIDLRWNGQRLIITPQTALKRPARKAFWTFSQLCEEYAR